MARPRKGEEKNRPIHLGFKVTEEMNAGLRQLAEKRGCLLSDVVVEILEDGLRRASVRATKGKRSSRVGA
jgi:hypothetical protein